MPSVHPARALVALGLVVGLGFGSAGCGVDAEAGAAAPSTASPVAGASAPGGQPRSRPARPRTERPTPAAPTPSGAPRRAPRALFFGDSYFVGGGYTDVESSMAALAARRLGWRYRVRGGGGTGFATDNPEYGLPDYLGQIDDGALDVGPVDWLVVEGGGNDHAVDPDVLTRAAVRTLDAAARRHPEARVVLLGSMDPTVDDFGDSEARTAALARAAERAGVPFVDAQRWLVGRPDLVGPDYVHPLPEGHRRCARELAAALRTLVRTAPR